MLNLAPVDIDIVSMKTLEIRERRTIAQMYKKFKERNGAIPMHLVFEFYTKMMLNRNNMDKKSLLISKENG